MARHRVISLGDALLQSLTGRTPRELSAGGGSLADQLTALADEIGGLRAVARLLGEPKTSITAWAHGTRKPRPATASRVLGKVGPALRRAQLPPGQEARLRGRRIQVSGTDRYDDRERIITAKGPTGDAVINAYLSGADLRGAFCDAIIDPADFYPGYFASDQHDFGIDVERVDWV